MCSVRQRDNTVLSHCRHFFGLVSRAIHKKRWSGGQYANNCLVPHSHRIASCASGRR